MPLLCGHRVFHRGTALIEEGAIDKLNHIAYMQQTKAGYGYIVASKKETLKRVVEEWKE